MVGLSDYRRYAERLVRAAGEGDAARARAARELEFARLYADHDRLLAERGALDFGDLVVRAFRLLHEKPHVRERVAAALPARAGRRVPGHELRPGRCCCGCSCEDHRNVTVVGDDDQAIYRFRGASQKNLLDFQREFPDAEVVRLERNYRSGRRILDAARAVVSAGAGPDREGAARREGGGCASGAAAPSAPRPRRWRPRRSALIADGRVARRRSACWCAR